MKDVGSGGLGVIQMPQEMRFDMRHLLIKKHIDMGMRDLIAMN
jgi:hypothetical protein